MRWLHWQIASLSRIIDAHDDDGNTLDTEARTTVLLRAGLAAVDTAKSLESPKERAKALMPLLKGFHKLQTSCVEGLDNKRATTISRKLLLRAGLAAADAAKSLPSREERNVALFDVFSSAQEVRKAAQPDEIVPSYFPEKLKDGTTPTLDEIEERRRQQKMCPFCPKEMTPFSNILTKHLKPSFSTSGNNSKTTKICVENRFAFLTRSNRNVGFYIDRERGQAMDAHLSEANEERLRDAMTEQARDHKGGRGLFDKRKNWDSYEESMNSIVEMKRFYDTAIAALPAGEDEEEDAEEVEALAADEDEEEDTEDLSMTLDLD